VTKIEARLASSVALATDVAWIDQCQKARSPAKARPAPASSQRSRGLGAPPARGASAAAAHNSGTASATRQNALAVGPTSAMRTQMGESAMQLAPAKRANRAGARMLGW